jgi:hypothetical protein
MRKLGFGKPHLRRALLTFLLAGAFVLSYAQNVGEYHHDVTVKEWDLQIFAHTAGFGGGFQHGRTPDLYNKHFWELQFMSNRHPKSVRSVNAFYENVRPIRYGQLFYLYFLQGGYGYQRTLHLKPYWGGVQIRYTLSAGPLLGIGIPNYIEVLNYNTGYSEIVRYDPEKHNLNNILGGARWYTGIAQTIFRPGFYAKTGLTFDFAKSDYKLRALEIGIQYQMVFPFIQQMAFNNAKPFYLTGYLSFNFGRKIGIHG